MTKLENLHRYISEAYPSGRINELLDATIDTVLEEERERTQKNFSLAVHNTCRKHKPEELKALTTLLNEPCLDALTKRQIKNSL